MAQRIRHLTTNQGIKEIKNKEKKNKLMIVVKKEIQDKGQEDKAEDENKIRP